MYSHLWEREEEEEEGGGKKWDESVWEREEIKIPHNKTCDNKIFIIVLGRCFNGVQL